MFLIKRLATAAAPFALIPALALSVPPAFAGPGPTTPATFEPSLTYVSCSSLSGEEVELPPDTRCAKLTVPLDWQTLDDGRTVDIAVTVTPANRKPGRSGLTWNLGGPGLGTIGQAGDFYSYLPKSIKKNFDWVSWDPRGTGLSEPKLKGCTPVKDMTPEDTGPVDWEAYWQKFADVSGAATRACIDANPDAAPYLGTWQVVRDMEALRVALGYDAWNYWGMSYGTRIGNVYARTFPDKLRALVQNGSLMANESIARIGSTTPAGNFAALQVYTSIAGKRQGEKIEELTEFLDKQTLPSMDGGAPLTRWQASTTLNSAIRSAKMIDNVPKIVNEFYAAMKAQEAGKTGRAARAMQRANQMISADEDSDSFLENMIDCLDLPDRPTVADVTRMSEAAEASYGTVYGFMAQRASMCFGVPSDFSTPVNDDYSLFNLPTRPLFLLTTGDAGTPWVWGRSLANTFVGSKTVTYDSTEHAAFFFTSSQCVKSAAKKYLLRLQLPKEDAFCQYSRPGPRP